MSLPELLPELSLLLPHRIYALGKPDKRTYFALPGPFQLWTNVGQKLGIQKDAYKHLESVLREECEARGWMWRVWVCSGGEYGAEVEGGRLGRTFTWFAPTPAEALALTVLAALKAETP